MYEIGTKVIDIMSVIIELLKSSGFISSLT